FAVYFALQPFAFDDEDEDGPGGRPGGGVPVPGSMPGGGAGGDASPEALAAMLMRAILDPDALRRFAAAAVTRHAGMEPGRPVGGTYYLYRTLRALDLDSLLDRLMEQIAAERGGFADELEERLARAELAARAPLPPAPPVQTGDHGGGRHLRLGGQLRPLHPAAGARPGQPVLPGAELRVHRRDRRGDGLLRGQRRPRRRGHAHQHRSRRRLGRR